MSEEIKPTQPTAPSSPLRTTVDDEQRKESKKRQQLPKGKPDNSEETEKHQQGLFDEFV